MSIEQTRGQGINKWFKTWEEELRKTGYPQAKAITANLSRKTFSQLSQLEQQSPYMTALVLSGYPQAQLDIAGPVRRIVCSLILRLIGMGPLASLYYPFSGKVSEKDKYQFFLDSQCTKPDTYHIPFFCKPFATCLHLACLTPPLFCLRTYYSALRITGNRTPSNPPWLYDCSQRLIDRIFKKHLFP